MGFIMFLAFSTLLIGFVVLSTEMNGETSSTPTDPPIVIFMLVIIGALALVAAIIGRFLRR